MTNAGIWLRVSDESQSEENQLPDLEQWCREHNYAIKRRFTVHGRSAWKAGKLTKDKSDVLSAFASGQIDVLVVWAVDRWSRSGIADLFDSMKAVRAAGGRVEFVKDAALNVEGPAQDLLLAVLGWVAEWESAHKSDRVKAGMARERANGKIMGGSVAFGYYLADGVRYRDEDALRVVHDIFVRSAEGQATATIGAWVRSQGYKRHDKTIADILRCPDYVADEVVSGALARAALEALESRRTATGRRTAAPDYSAMVYCRCGAVMHRRILGSMPANGVAGTRYYRCSSEKAAHPGGRGSVPMVRADDADWLVEHVMLGDQQPWFIPVRLGGDTRDAEIARLRKRLTTARTRQETDVIWDEIDAVENREPEPERIEWIPSGKSRADHWAELTLPERRAWLESEQTFIVVWNVRTSVRGPVTPDGEAWARGRVRMVIEQEEA